MDCVFTFAPLFVYFFFFFNDTATTEIYTLSLHDALPISITSATRTRILKAAVYSGIPVAIVGRGNNEGFTAPQRSEEHTSELQSLAYLVCRLLLEKKKKKLILIHSHRYRTG